MDIKTLLRLQGVKSMELSKALHFLYKLKYFWTCPGMENIIEILSAEKAPKKRNTFCVNFLIFGYAFADFRTGCAGISRRYFYARLIGTSVRCLDSGVVRITPTCFMQHMERAPAMEAPIATSAATFSLECQRNKGFTL